VLGVNDNTLTRRPITLFPMPPARPTVSRRSPSVARKFRHQARGYDNIHSYTNDQQLLDLRTKICGAHERRHVDDSDQHRRSQSTSSGHPQLKGKLDGLAIRVPTPNVSLVDLTVETEKDCTIAEVNAAFKKAAEVRSKASCSIRKDPIVSIDKKGDPHSATLDAPLTNVIDKRMVKVTAWYDNEWGYSAASGT